MHGDADALERVLRNLGDNAARHATSRIKIALAERGSEMLLTFDDDGLGIPEQERGSRRSDSFGSTSHARMMRAAALYCEVHGKDVGLPVHANREASERPAREFIPALVLRHGRDSSLHGVRHHTSPRPGPDGAGCRPLSGSTF